MKIILATLFVFCVKPLMADVIVIDSFSGWDHGFVIKLDSTTNKVSYIERKSRTEHIEHNHTYLKSGSVVDYVSNLFSVIKANEVGGEAVDGRVVTVTLIQEGKTQKKIINWEELFIEFHSDPKLSKKYAKAHRKWIKDHSDVILLQKVITQLEERFSNKE